METIIIVIVICMLIAVLFLKKAASKKGAARSMLTVAHRGASGYAPENTIASYDKAIEMKADFIEIDLQVSKDGRLMVIHDDSVERTTNGKGNVRDLTFNELRKLDAGSWFHGSFAGQKIPTFDEVLDRYSEKCGLLIELKSPALYPGIEQKVYDALASRGLIENRKTNVIVQSFDTNSMKRFHEIAPTIPIGVLVKFTPKGISNTQLEEFKTYANYVNPNRRLVTKKLIARIHEHDMKIIPYTIRDRKTAKAFMLLDLDGITTDFPDYIKAQKA
ncbi:glycerophosphodiester phosphodiesterase [Metabacillus idriensis]|uniref:glycerophosphodiester phosphodiesterase n=1 Tax=Metabacillus idriensis TaxID=324768 RepID=UPI00174E6A8A|nr:glycerophosphodiester phosphodiesterase family protein [Metabacillus idriensis]